MEKINMSNYEEKLTKFKNNCEKNAKQDAKNINNELNKKRIFQMKLINIKKMQK